MGPGTKAWDEAAGQFNRRGAVDSDLGLEVELEARVRELEEALEALEVNAGRALVGLLALAYLGFCFWVLW
jgi:hypothetical protein